MIREARKEDIAAIEEIAQLEELDPVPREIMEHASARVLEREGQIIGFWLGEELGRDVFLLRDFVIRREERYHLWGREMMEELLRTAREGGFRMMMMVLHHPLPASEDFLLREGWIVIYETGDTRIFSRSLIVK